jgi:hypothetical protein
MKDNPVESKSETGNLNDSSNTFRIENCLGHDLLDETLSLGHSISSDGLLSVESMCDSNEGKDYLNAALSDGQSISSDDLLSEGSDLVDDFSPFIQDVPSVVQQRSTAEGGTTVPEVQVVEFQDFQDSPEDENDSMNFVLYELETIMEEGETDEEKEEFRRQKEMYFKLSKTLGSRDDRHQQKPLNKPIENTGADSHNLSNDAGEFQMDKNENALSYDASDEYELDEPVLSSDPLLKECNTFQLHQSNVMKAKCMKDGDQISVDSSDRGEHSVIPSEIIVAQTDKIGNGTESALQQTGSAHDNGTLKPMIEGFKGSNSVVLYPLETKENDFQEQLEKRTEMETTNVPKLELSEQDTCSCEIDSRRKEYENDNDIENTSYSLLHESSTDDEITLPYENVEDDSHIKGSLSSLERQLEEDDNLYTNGMTPTIDAKWGILNIIWSSLYRLTSRQRVTSDTETTERLLTNGDYDFNHDDPEFLSNETHSSMSDQILSVLCVSLFLTFLTMLFYFLFLL